MIVIRDWKTFYFDFDWTKGVDKNLKHEVEYIIKSNEALPDGSYSVSDIQDYFEYFIKKHETSTTIHHIHVYINRINHRIVLNMKDAWKLELQTPETMKLFGTTKILIDKTKNGENIPSPEVAEVFLVWCNLVDN